jgi:hypothetical protein
MVAFFITTNVEGVFMSTITQVSTGVYTLYSDSAAPATASGVKNSSTSVYWITGDNIANGAAVYVQIFNKPSGDVTVGVTPADLIFYVGGSSQETYDFQIPWIFSNGFSFAVTSTASNSSSPGVVSVTIAYN